VVGGLPSNHIPIQWNEAPSLYPLHAKQVWRTLVYSTCMISDDQDAIVSWQKLFIEKSWLLIFFYGHFCVYFIINNKCHENNNQQNEKNCNPQDNNTNNLQPRFKQHLPRWDILSRKSCGRRN